MTRVLAIGDSEWEARNGFIGGVTDAKLLRSGGIAYFDGQVHALRLISPDGAVTHEVGREGDGPDEWSRRTAGLVVLSGDTVVVVDPGNAKLGFIASDGRVVRTERLTGAFGPQWRVLGDSLLVHDSFLPPASLTSVSLKDAGTETLFRFDFEPSPISRGNVPLAPLMAPGGRWALIDDYLVIAVSTDPVVTLLHLGTGGSTQFRLERNPARTSGADRAHLGELWTERLGIGDIPRPMWSQIEVVYPDELPVMGHIALGPDGSIWIQRPSDVGSIRASELAPGPLNGLGGTAWDVFTVEGVPVGFADFGTRLRILDTLGGRLLTLREDELGRNVLETWVVRPHR